MIATIVMRVMMIAVMGLGLKQDLWVVDVENKVDKKDSRSALESCFGCFFAWISGVS
jgi:hypothetical protein